ncbi:hypothetical protein FHX34_1011156 [Actinoplanes teichomyceticus]|uniref:Uncharacterized protein n=1 Tax=Actinoplanes teichomyceticus TaxID=1867 RepID=A0A561WQM7_ACTTI|nr:hypothetical protein FHX34_1011156 [Actinoplanes teichomyceticus]
MPGPQPFRRALLPGTRVVGPKDAGTTTTGITTAQRRHAPASGPAARPGNPGVGEAHRRPHRAGIPRAVDPTGPAPDVRALRPLHTRGRTLPGGAAPAGRAPAPRGPRAPLTATEAREIATPRLSPRLIPMAPPRRGRGGGAWWVASRRSGIRSDPRRGPPEKHPVTKAPLTWDSTARDRRSAFRFDWWIRRTAALPESGRRPQRVRRPARRASRRAASRRRGTGWECGATSTAHPGRDTRLGASAHSMHRPRAATVQPAGP